MYIYIYIQYISTWTCNQWGWWHCKTMYSPTTFKSLRSPDTYNKYVINTGTNVLSHLNPKPDGAKVH